nr:EAL domain-containing protein [Rhodococcus sp. (in: high G+C Gram-positive bacteria)]
MARRPDTPHHESDRLLDVRCLYQPIVHLESGHVVGYEALARWPSYPDITPEAAFERARRSGMSDEIEWACRLAAVRGALDAELGKRHTLFVNIEADTTPGSQPDDAAELIAGATTRLRVTVEVTERSLLTDPGRLMTTMAVVRSLGYGVALDDVGSNPDSLTIMEFVAPDVVKLDRRLVQDEPTREEAKVLTAVTAYGERTNTTILAEGIESAEHLARARSLGATLGQGWYLGRPTDLARPVTVSMDTATAIPFFHSGATESDPLWNPISPADLFHAITPREAEHTLIATITQSIEDHAQSLSEPLSIVAAFRSATDFTSETAARYARLAETNPLVAVLARDMPPAPATNVRGLSISKSDPLGDLWVLTVVGRHYFAAVIARPISSSDRRLEYVLTYDHANVMAAARSMASRLSTIEGTLPPLSTLSAGTEGPQ